MPVLPKIGSRENSRPVRCLPFLYVGRGLLFIFPVNSSLAVNISFQVRYLYDRRTISLNPYTLGILGVEFLQKIPIVKIVLILSATAYANV